MILSNTCCHATPCRATMPCHHASLHCIMPQVQERTGLEAQHRNKINAEINRYQAMVQEKEELSRKWDEEVRELIHTFLFQGVGGARVTGAFSNARN